MTKIIDNVFIGLAYIFTFILIYNPQIYGFPLQRILYPLSLLYFIFLQPKLYNPEKKLLGYALCCVIFGIINTLLQGTKDFGMLLISRVFFGVFSAIMIYDLLQRANYKVTESTILKLISFTGIFQATIILISFFVPEIKSLLLELNTVSETSDKWMYSQSLFRGVGWGTFQYAHMAIILGSSFFCFVSYITIYKNNTIKKVLNLIFILLFLSAGVLVARTYLIIIAILIFYWSIIYLKHHGSYQYMKALFGGGIFIVFVVASLFVKLQDTLSEQTLQWMFEFFENFSTKGKFESGSTDVLARMWHFPDNLKTWLFGDARTAGLFGAYNYTESDIGIVNSLYCWGILGSFLYFLCLFKSFEYPAKLARRFDVKYLICIIFLINIGYQFKETLNLFPLSCLFLRGELLTRFKDKTVQAVSMCLNRRQHSQLYESKS